MEELIEDMDCDEAVNWAEEELRLLNATDRLEQLEFKCLLTVHQFKAANDRLADAIEKLKDAFDEFNFREELEDVNLGEINNG